MKITDEVKELLVLGHNDGRPFEFVRDDASGNVETRLHFDRIVLHKVAGGTRMDFCWDGRAVIEQWLPDATEASIPIAGSINVIITS